jgi:hypothetical protein
MVCKLKSTVETRKRNNQSKNKFPIYKNTDLFKKNKKSLKLVVEFATKNTDLLTHTVAKCS